MLCLLACGHLHDSEQYMKNLPVLPYYFLKGQIQLNKFISLENKHLFLASEVKKKKDFAFWKQ